MGAERLAEGVVRGKAEVECHLLDAGTALQLFDREIHATRVKILSWGAAEGRKKNACEMLSRVAECHGEILHVKGIGAQTV